MLGVCQAFFNKTAERSNAVLNLFFAVSKNTSGSAGERR